MVLVASLSVCWSLSVCSSPSVCASLPQSRLATSRVGAPIACTATTTAATVVAADALKPPIGKEEMLSSAAAAVTRAKADGVSRFTLRLFLPRGDDDNLYPPDESWQGGIMQLFSEASPLVRDLLRRLSTEVAGVPPSLTEQA